MMGIAGNAKKSLQSLLLRSHEQPPTLSTPFRSDLHVLIRIRNCIGDQFVLNSFLDLTREIMIAWNLIDHLSN